MADMTPCLAMLIQIGALQPNRTNGFQVQLNMRISSGDHSEIAASRPSVRIISLSHFTLRILAAKDVDHASVIVARYESVLSLV